MDEPAVVSGGNRGPSAGGPSVGGALALYAIASALLLLVFAPVQRWRLVPGLLTSEWGGWLGVTILYARFTGQRLRGAINWRRPTATSLVGGALVGLSAWLVVGLAADWLLPAPKHVVDDLRRTIAPGNGGRGLALTLFTMALTPAVCEEALFRGPILRGLATRLRPAAAAVATGVLFGLFHGDPWRLLPTAIIGVLLSAVALAADSIAPAMLAHLINNACVILLVRAHRGNTDEFGSWAKLGAAVGGAIVLAIGVLLLRPSPRAPAEPQRVM